MWSDFNLGAGAVTVASVVSVTVYVGKLVSCRNVDQLSALGAAAPFRLHISAEVFQKNLSFFSRGNGSLEI